MHILDVGCGPGTITADLAALLPQGQVVGIDSSAEVLEKARDIAAERGVKNVRFEVGDVQKKLEYADGTFDVVHAHQVLQHLRDPVQALREMSRVARKGGIIAVRETDFAAMTWYPEVEGMENWRDLYLRVARASGGEPNAGRRIHVWARQAGLDPWNMTVSAGTWCYHGPTERVWWSELWADRTVHSSFAERAVQSGNATPEELQRIANVWREWGADEDGWFGVLHGEFFCRV